MLQDYRSGYLPCALTDESLTCGRSEVYDKLEIIDIESMVLTCYSYILSLGNCSGCLVQTIRQAL